MNTKLVFPITLAGAIALGYYGYLNVDGEIPALPEQESPQQTIAAAERDCLLGIASRRGVEATGISLRIEDVNVIVRTADGFSSSREPRLVGYTTDGAPLGVVSERACVDAIVQARQPELTRYAVTCTTSGDDMSCDINEYIQEVE